MVKVKKTSKLPAHGVVVESHHHEPDFRTASHTHGHHNVIYVVSGQGQCRVGEAAYSVQPNTALILKKGQLHQLIDAPKTPMVVFVLYFANRLAMLDKRSLKAFKELPTCLAVPPHRSPKIRRALRTMLHEQNARTEHFELAMQQCLASILLELFRTRDDQRQSPAARADSRHSITRVEDVLHYLTTHYYEVHSLSSAAKMAHLSRRQFSNLCRRMTKTSFTQFVNGIRVEKAREMITHSDRPVSSIAFEVGFEDLSTFYRAFRKRFRASPLTFRRHVPQPPNEIRS